MTPTSPSAAVPPSPSTSTCGASLSPANPPGWGQLQTHDRESAALFREIGLPLADAQREASRCLTCGCQKSDCCAVRSLATEYQADPYRFPGARRRFAQDNSHPEIVYEPGKCILCDACVRIAAQGAEPLGLAAIGRGFDVAIAPPFHQPLSAALLTAARQYANACPTAAFSLRGSRPCDLDSPAYT